jgi:hypothetical protein
LISLGLIIRSVKVKTNPMKIFFLCMMLSLALWTNCQHFRDNRMINDSVVNSIVVRYDPQALRIPEGVIPIGLSTTVGKHNILETKGYLKGTLNWSKFRIEVDKGNFCFGKVKLDPSDSYMKNEAFTINVYSRRSKKLLCSQRINYNYETDIEVIPSGKFNLAPGNKIKIGFRTYFDNEMHRDSWLGSSSRAQNGFILRTDGGYLSGSRFIINSDPFTIKNHTVKLSSCLLKNRDISDTLNLLLDYIDNYQCYISGMHGYSGSSGFSGYTGGCGAHGGDGYPGGTGHDLDVFADVYFDTILYTELMYLQVIDLEINKEINYLINVKGGSIDIFSTGGSGGNGGDGGDGGNGCEGASGAYYTKTIRINDSTTTTVTEQGPGQPGGNGGHGGSGGDGAHGGRGGNIYVNYTPQAQPFLFMIHAISSGGSGGLSGSAGSGGRGGNGGSGNPSGTSGSSGFSGSSGSSGSRGYDGEVYFIALPSDEQLNDALSSR